MQAAILYTPLRHWAKARIDAIDYLVAGESLQEGIAIGYAFLRRLIPYQLTISVQDVVHQIQIYIHSFCFLLFVFHPAIIIHQFRSQYRSAETSVAIYCLHRNAPHQIAEQRHNREILEDLLSI